MDPSGIITLAVTTAGVLLALAAIYGTVMCSMPDILAGRVACTSDDPLHYPDDEDDNLIILLVLNAQMENAAAAAAALCAEKLLISVHLFGMNVGQWYIKPRSMT
jgi:hypothetical protein